MEKNGNPIPMFRGSNSINLDEKGRISVPTQYRARLAEESAGRLVITIDTQETCLLLYPIREWEIIEQKLEKLPSFNKAARRIQRLLVGHATELKMDGFGRILLPPSLRDHANLKKNCMLIGQVNKFEIWSDENWQTRREDWLDEETNSDDLPAELADLSL